MQETQTARNLQKQGGSSEVEQESRFQIFRRGSRTYFMSSLFFPAELRDKVARLYAFVRLADDFVDQLPQDVVGFTNFENDYRNGLKGKPARNNVIASFIELQRTEGFEQEWVDSFLAAMRSDLNHRPCKEITDTINYMYGSAEVIGLMMTRLMNLPDESHNSAARLGRAMQYINFIRDIHEDQQLGRTYLPVEEMRKFGLQSLTPREATRVPDKFQAFMHSQVSRYLAWQTEAEAGFHYLPKRVRIPVATASQMYKWTGECILNDPFRVFKEKIKPSRTRVIVGGMSRSVQTLIS